MASEDVKKALVPLREDYARATGKPFRHFYCPLLLKDEATALCMGHVVNQAFPDSCRTRVVQRADVDNFYGSVAEAEFTAMLAARGAGLEGIFASGCSKRIKRRIVVDGEDCKYYPYRGNMNPQHSRIVLENEKGGDVQHLVLEKSNQEMLDIQHKPWSLVVECDVRVAALATLIKAAYLSLFRLFGYAWALSAAGLSIGHDLLGRFYRENVGKSLADAKEAAKSFFRPYVHMVRPILGCTGTPPRGTIEDNRAGVCFGSSGHPFAVAVCVRTGTDLHSVLMPAFDNPDSAATYWNFLGSDRESLRIWDSVFEAERGRWVVNEPPMDAFWPKQEDALDN